MESSECKTMKWKRANEEKKRWRVHGRNRVGEERMSSKQWAFWTWNWSRNTQPSINIGLIVAICLDFHNHNLFNSEDWLKLTHSQNYRKCPFRWQAIMFFFRLFVCMKWLQFGKWIYRSIKQVDSLNRIDFRNGAFIYVNCTKQVQIKSWKSVLIENDWNQLRFSVSVCFLQILWLFAEENIFLCNKMICDRSLVSLKWPSQQVTLGIVLLLCIFISV